MKLITRSALAILGSTSALSAATFFTEDFSSGTSGSNMTLGTGLAGATTSFAGQNFTITSGDGSRIYLGTNGIDYSTVDFVFQATFTINGGSAWDTPYLGMGNPTAGTNAFGEPVTGTAEMFMLVRPDVGGGTLYSGYNLASNATANTSQGAVTGALAGPVLLRMIWTASTKTAEFQYDAGNNGSIEKSFILTDSANTFTASNSQLFLGGGSGLIADNVSVQAVPEPSTYGLIGAGALAAVATVRRRRKHAGKAA